ncbi:MAG: hypothetical protein JXR96_03380 [Deltaproteobacteria bacterium]|nr:hypothetical protein [Deltaproteobacteria bacterium]
MNTRRWLILAAAVLACAGCGEAGRSCRVDTDCPGNEMCIDGRCSSGCPELPCEDGELCHQGRCYAEDCQTRSCPGVGIICVDEQCLGTDCIGVTCPQGERCAAGRCYPIDCETKTCAGYGEVCVDDICLEALCLGVECPEGEQCAGGRCYPDACADRTCEAGEVCVDDTCVEAGCAGVACPPGQRCADGSCWPEDCEQADCGPGEVCELGRCVLAECVHDRCPDGCPDDPDKTEPGICGCGVPDTDVDADGTPDCLDACPDDRDKTEPGICGCGVPDTDVDADGTLDCLDCAPRNAAVHPEATEICNGIDDDCNGQVDEAGCPCSVRSWRGHSYMLCQEALGWLEAQDACRAYVYTLATIDSPEENEMLWAWIAELGGAETWHGFNDRDSEGDWLWEGGWSAVYINWEEYQPDGLYGENCVHWWAGHDGRWNDRLCSVWFEYLCESDCADAPDPDGDGYGDTCDCGPLDPHRHPGVTEICNGKDDDCDGVVDQIEGCPCLTQAIGGHVYSFCDDGVSWDEAEQLCQSYGAHLVTIDGEAENGQIRDVMIDVLHTGDFWIGYSDKDLEGSWGWADGSAPSYVNWGGGEPNGGTGENCAEVFSNGRWNDTNCSDRKEFVCERVPCPGDVFVDIDGDGICGDVDTCPLRYDPEQAGPCRDASCKDLLDSGVREDGIYWICPAGTALPLRVWCDMHTAGGGWTLVATYGVDGRPSSTFPGSYPRPGATCYGWADGAVFDPSRNDAARNFSIYAAPLWDDSNGEILAYVGGSTDDFVTASLPMGCNYFDPSDWCPENAYGPFEVLDSSGSVLTANGYACTTAHGQGAFAGDPYDEFGLHLLDGPDDSDPYHCDQTASGLGHEDMGRIFTSFESSSGDYWDTGIHSHWNDAGLPDQPGALLVR